MCLSSKNDSLAILDTKKLKVFIFSTNTFKVIRSFPVEGIPRQILWQKEGFVLFSPYPFNFHNGGYKISLLDESGSLVNRIDKGKVSRRDLKTLTAFHSIFTTKSGFAFWDISMSEILEYSNGKTQSLLTFEPWAKKNFRKKWGNSIEALTV